LATAARYQDGGDNEHLESCKRWRVHSHDLTEWEEEKRRVSFTRLLRLRVGLRAGPWRGATRLDLKTYSQLFWPMVVGGLLPH
jgi:hypothetical protein